MQWLRATIDTLFQRNAEPNDEANSALEKMTQEITGSIWTLVSLFLLVSLTSYIPLDSFNLFQGRLDHMNNLGGIVGALFGEWFLGTVGAPGYSVVILSAWLALAKFRGLSIRDNLFQISGVIVGTVFSAITCHLIWFESAPEASLLQGGFLGRMVGSLLRHYFNTTGAILIVIGGFVVTIILTTGASFSGAVGALFREGEQETKQEEEAEEETTAPRSRPHLAVVNPAAQKPKPAKKSRKKPAKGEDGEDLEATDELDLNQSDEEDEEAGGRLLSYEFEEMVPFSGKYDVPGPRLLKNIPSDAKKFSRGELKETSRKLCEHLLSFQITGDVTDVTQGPVLITYEYKPSAGVKLSKIAALQDDLGVVLGTRELRIMAPIPGKTVVGIEVARPKAEVIALKDVLGEKEFHDKKIKIPVALGKATDGTPVFGDLTAMPHLLVAGATGSGKSVFINSLIMSFLFRLTPQQLRLILIDPKMLELSVFDGIPHLITNVITANGIAYNALKWTVDEMERRYSLMAETGSKNVDSYNSKQKNSAHKLPFIVVVVDELADLMMSGGKDVEVFITRLAQKARASGIHLVIATQRPSTDVITGLIKANIPSRLSFKVPSGIDSRTVLDVSGAEDLIGRGDSLMIQPAAPLRRLHGTFVTEEDLARVVKFVKGGRDHTKNYIQFPNHMPSKD